MDQPTKKILDRLEKNFDNWRQTLLLQYKEGASDREVMTHLKLSIGAWNTLYGNVLDVDFRELVDLGRVLAHAWWDKQGRTNLHNPKFQTALWTVQMKNRYGYSEKTEQTITNAELKNLDDSELKLQIQKLQKQLENGRGKTAI